MRIIVVAMFAFMLIGCESYLHKKHSGSTQLVVGVDGKVKVIDPKGNLVSPVPCDRYKQRCMSFDKDGKIISVTNVGIVYTQLNNPHCCYLFEFDGKYEEFCWNLPAGQQCPNLN